jgi:hypothetical protein
MWISPPQIGNDTLSSAFTPGKVLLTPRNSSIGATRCARVLKFSVGESVPKALLPAFIVSSRRRVFFARPDRRSLPRYRIQRNLASWRVFLA